jgi:hypothetical protein
MTTIDTAVPNAPDAAFHERRRIADRIFRGALLFNAALTVYWVAVSLTGGTAFYTAFAIDREALTRIAFGILIFNIAWGFSWYGVKTLLLKYIAGFSKAERRQAFSSRMQEPFDVAALVARHSERKIRIIDMIGRRGRFITLACAGFFYLYANQQSNPSPAFVTGFTQDNLFDAVVSGWVFLAFYYANNFVAAAMYGPQSRIMDGVLARANCLLITTLWAAFKFILVPLGARLATLFHPSEFASIFAMIWGSYIACDALAEIGGSLFGKQSIRVLGIGDVNRKSVGGTISGFAGSLVLCLWVVLGQSLPASWIVLAVVISISNTVLELWSPRGTDDFTMATSNALICWAFGVLRTTA